MLLEDFNLSEGPQVDYIYLNGRPIAVLNNVNGPVYFLHDDSLGTPQLATDSNQNIAWQTSYQPFGQASVSGTITQNLRFPGQYFDVESGWNHNGFRDYIPSLGRYVEPDPLDRAGSGNNFYAYVGNNPINNIDPLGLTTVTSPVWFPGASADNVNGGFTMNVNDGSDATTVLKMLTLDDVLQQEQKLAKSLKDMEKQCGKNRKNEKYFDTKYFKGLGNDRDYYYVQGMDRIYADNEINYFGIGMYERWLGDSLLEAEAITLAWKETQYPGTPIPSGTWYWLQRGYDDYPNMGGGSSGGSSGSSGGGR
ncbi:MAG: RHS repeat-associated core domain-containing protein [Terracidiphilus sp.]